MSKLKIMLVEVTVFNSSPSEKNGRHFTNNIFKHIFLNEI